MYGGDDTMRRICWTLAMVLALSVSFTACGKKDAAGVVKDLNEKVGDLKSYQGSGIMTLHTGDTPQQYHVEVWHQQPSYYRIALTNTKKDITQIVLRNDEGVFVLTPSMNKSFRFQSDWPNSQGQVYLFETLARSIIGDSTRQFTTEKDNYVFDVNANYNTHALVRQKIWLNKKNYAPKQVDVCDSNAKVVVQVKFDSFTFGNNFDKKDFDMQQNMTAHHKEKNTINEVNDDEEDISSREEKSSNEQNETNTTNQNVEKKKELNEKQHKKAEPKEQAKKNEKLDKKEGAAKKTINNFGVIEPSYVPSGVNLKDDQISENSNNYSVMLRYEGQYHYTIFEAAAQDRAVSLAPSTLVDLGFTFGVLSGDLPQTLTWMNDGIEFRITSGDLPVSEMMNIAASMQQQTGK